MGSLIVEEAVPAGPPASRRDRAGIEKRRRMRVRSVVRMSTDTNIHTITNIHAITLEAAEPEAASA